VKRTTKILLWLTAIFFFISINSFAASEDKSDEFILEVKDKRITLQADKVSFKQILTKLQEKSNIKFIFSGNIPDRKVSINVASVPTFAVGSILKKMSVQNSAVIRDTKNNSIRVYILSQGEDISKITKGKSAIKSGDLSLKDDVKIVKGKKFVSKIRGKEIYPVRYVEDEVLLKFHMGATKQDIDDELQRHNLVQIDNGTLSKLGYIIISIPAGKEVISVIKEIRKEPLIKIIEPNYVLNFLTDSDQYN
jgi:hypothetical protein